MTPSRQIVIGSLLLLVLSGGAAWLAFQPSSSPEPLLKPDDAQLVGQGERIYESDCASCHGTDLEGEEDWRRRDADGYLPAPPHDETGHTWHHPDEMLFEMTKYGMEPFAGEDYPSRMPAFADALTDAEIVAVLSYIKSRWPEEIRQRHDMMNERFRETDGAGG